MNANWYCRTCTERIDRDDVEAHESAGHDVKGVLRPDRLLSNDPWAVGDGDPRPDAGPTNDADDGEVTD
ncbi:MAG: hypothetical protein ABEJ88_04270 [Halobacterium sp.]